MSGRNWPGQQESVIFAHSGALAIAGRAPGSAPRQTLLAGATGAWRRERASGALPQNGAGLFGFFRQTFAGLPGF